MSTLYETTHSGSCPKDVPEVDTYELSSGGIKKIVVEMSVSNTQDPVTQTHAQIGRNKLSENKDNFIRKFLYGIV